MSFLVTGAQGMLGRRLVESLSPLGPVVGVDLVDFDITDGAATRERLAAVRPAVVVHAAAMTDVDGCEMDPESARRTNVLGTESVARAAAEVGARMVMVSTDFVFDGRAVSPYGEEAPTGPGSVYGRTKLEAEEVVRRLCENHLVVRTAWLFGPEGKNFVRTILQAARNRPELQVVDDQVGSPTFTRDLAIMIRGLIQAGANGTVHAVNRGQASWYDLARRALELAGSETPVRPMSSAELDRPAPRPAYSVLATDRLTHWVGREPRGWPQALEDYIREDWTRGDD